MDPSTDAAGAGKPGGKVSAEEAAEEQRRKGVVQELQRNADSVAIMPGDYQVHVHVLMAKDLKAEVGSGYDHVTVTWLCPL